MRSGRISALYGLLLLLLIALLWRESLHEQYAVTGLGTAHSAVFYPRLLLLVMAALALALTVRGLLVPGEPVMPTRWGRLALSVALAGIYTALVPLLGFLLASVAFLLTAPAATGFRKPRIVIAVAVVFPLVLWYLFHVFMQITLPTSPWFDRL